MAAAAASNAKRGLLFWKDGNGAGAPARAAAAPIAGAAAEAATNWRKYLPGGSAAAARPIVTDAFKLLFYAASGLFAIFLILIIVHFTVYPVFSFMPGDGGYINVPFFSDAQTMAADKANPSSDALKIDGAPSAAYSIAFDLVIPSDFTNLQTPRVLLYRATTAIGSGEAPPAANGTKTLKGYEAYLREKYSDTNIVVWLDPVLNDLYVSAILTPVDGGPKRVYTSHPIKNLPQSKKIRVAIVFTDVFAEVYVNGYLRQTLTFKPAQGALLEMDSSKKFFTTPAIKDYNVALPAVMNVSFWPRPLAAGEAMGGA